MRKLINAIAHFVDPKTFEVLDVEPEPVTWIDRRGREFVGDDDENVWWGTEDACWVISAAATRVEVYGTIGAREYGGHFIGTEEEAEDYAERRGVRVTLVNSEPLREQRRLGNKLTATQCAALRALAIEPRSSFDFGSTTVNALRRHGLIQGIGKIEITPKGRDALAIGEVRR